MANLEHLKIFDQGVDVWNEWRQQNPEVKPDLSGAHLFGKIRDQVNLRGANLSGANLSQTMLTRADIREANLIESRISLANLYRSRLSDANLRGSILVESCLSDADLYKADLSGANLSRAELIRSNLTDTNFSGANLSRAILTSAWLDSANFNNAILQRAWLNGARLVRTTFRDANLSGARLENSLLVETDLAGTDLSGCFVYGLSAWDLQVNDKTKQNGLIITPFKAPEITVDDIEVAQFIYLLLNRKKLRNLINTITSKAVLILGRFIPERKAVLDLIADEVRKYNLLPIIFDFERATTRDFTETIKTLAGLSLFVIADITNPKSAPLELQATVPDYQIPFVPIIQEGEEPFSMFRDLTNKYDWVLKPLMYSSSDKLLQSFKKAIVERAMEKHQELQKKKREEVEILSVEDFLENNEKLGEK